MIKVYSGEKECDILFGNPIPETRVAAGQS
ncbi:MAG: hypothetical protein JWQ72_1530 [Polaromonas sp.]|nr:hypothetical protein [Polaromonas sp.]